MLQHTALLAVAGSRAYGMATASSDVDLRGFFAPPIPSFLSFRDQIGQVDDTPSIQVLVQHLTDAEKATGEIEGSIYHVAKFTKLAAECNPNILDVLYCREEELRVVTKIGRAFRDNRSVFLSQQARHRYAGYAKAQLARVERHRKWLFDPPTRPPERADFDLPVMPLLPRDQRDAALAAIAKRIDGWELDLSLVPPSVRIDLLQRVAQVLFEQGLDDPTRFALAGRGIGIDDNMVQMLLAERRYKSAVNHWRSYQTWLRQRNPERAVLEAKHGYDTKHAAHLIRLLRMGCEIAQDGEVIVWRGGRDAKELLSIKQGAWSWDRLMLEIEQANQMLKQSSGKLPKNVDREALDQWLIALLEDELSAAKPNT